MFINKALVSGRVVTATVYDDKKDSKHFVFFVVVTNSYYQNGDGDIVEIPSYITIKSWDKNIIKKFKDGVIEHGDLIYVEGELRSEDDYIYIRPSKVSLVKKSKKNEIKVKESHTVKRKSNSSNKEVRSIHIRKSKIIK